MVKLGEVWDRAMIKNVYVNLKWSSLSLYFPSDKILDKKTADSSKRPILYKNNPFLKLKSERIQAIPSPFDIS